jgi:hypothetical protein
MNDILSLKDQLKNLEDAFPSMFMRLNIAQYKALKDIYTYSDGKAPDIASIEFANGCGKTHLLALDHIGLTMGSAYLQREYFPAESISYYDGALITKKRDKGILNLRLVCTSGDMKAGGSVHTIFKQVLPYAKFTAKDNSGCYRQIDIPHPHLPNIVNSIAVKTFEQSTIEHSGSTCDRVSINEYLPENLWGETMGRIRGGGSIVQYATILELSTALDNVEDSDDIRLIRCKGHLFENCKSEEVTDEMAREVLAEVGHVLVKCKTGKGYITNGVLAKLKIDAQIDFWKKAVPHELQARKSGRPLSGGGKIWPTYNPTVHVIPNGTYDGKGYPMFQVIDPHPRRPDAVIYGLILPSDRLVIIDEWPSVEEFGYFDKIRDNKFTIPQKCEIWANLESRKGYTDFIGKNRIGDPNRFREPDPMSRGTLASLYAKHGFSLNTNVKDGFEYGREIVAQYLYCDIAELLRNPDEPGNRPRMMIYERCHNTKKMFANFSAKVDKDLTKPISERVDERYACFGDLVRYAAVWHSSGNKFIDVRNRSEGVSDLDKIKLSRIPKAPVKRKYR